MLTGIGAINGFIAVALGAFGAHGLKTVASAEQLAWFETGTHYHMYHALAIMTCAIVAIHLGQYRLIVTGYLFQAGILIFSGTLYLMALGAPRWLGAITPIGGTMLLIAWGLLAWSLLRRTGSGNR